jgi:uncharacterized protein
MQYEILHALSKVGGRSVCDLDDEGPTELDAPIIGHVVGQVVLTNSGSGIAATGRLRATVRMECSRCLRAVDVPLDMAVSEDCALTQIDDPRQSEADQIPLLDDTVVDLSELVRQLVSVHTPPRTVCSAQCRGLCPHCGADLNVKPCDCSTEQIDPRFAALRGLMGE